MSGDATLANDGTLTIADNAITNIKMADNAIGSNEVIDNSLTSDDIGADAVTASEIATDAVTTDEILNGTIATVDIADDNVTLAKIENGAADHILTTDASGNPQYEDKSAITVGTATNFNGSLSGDVTGTQGATVVESVGGSTASNISTAEALANAATDANTASTIVRRDASGDFNANMITANLTGDVTGDVSGTASNVTGTVAIANGGTGATDAATARTNLDLEIGTNVQAYNAKLDAISGLAVTDGNIIVGDGSTFVAESGATARTSLGAAASGANTDITSVVLNQSGLVVKGGDDNALTIKPNETLTANRTLNIITGNADRTLTLDDDATISGTNTGDQTSIVGIEGTLPEFNTALTDDDFVSLTGTETLTNKTLTSPTLTNPDIGEAIATSINNVAITDPGTTATLTLADNSSLITSGANSVTLTSTGVTNVTLPTSGTLSTLTGTETLSNKTLTSPVLSSSDGSAGSAPLKFTAGTDLGSPEAGAMEYDGTNFSVTNSTATRYTLAKTLTATATLDFAATLSRTAPEDLTITVNGASVGDVVSVGVPAAAQIAGVTYSAFVSAADVVTVRAVYTDDGTVDPGSGTFRVSVLKY